MPNWNDANDILNWLRSEQLKKQQEEEAQKRAENEARAIVAQPNPQPSLADQMWRPSAQVDTGIRATNTMQPTQTMPYVEPPIVESARTPLYPQNEMAFTGGPEEEEEKPARDWTEQEINRAGVGLQWRNPWEAWRSGQASYGATYEPAARALTNVHDWWNQTGAPLLRSWTQPAAPGVAEENTQRLASGDLRLSEAGAWTRETPAYQYAQERIQERKDRIAAEQATEPTTGLGQMWQDMGGLRDVGGSLFDVWDYWMRLNTTTPPSQFGGAQEAVEAGNADYFQRGLAKLAEDTQDRPLMAYLAPVGEYANRRFNPFERYLDFLEWSTGDPTQQGEYGAGGFLAPLGDTTFMQFMNQKLQEYDRQQDWYNKLSPDKRESAKIAFAALQSQGLQAAAKALLDPNDTRPRTERVDSVMNPWALIVEGMTTDPIDWLSFGVGQVGALGKGGASIIEQFAEQAARRNILDISVEQAAKNWAEGVKRIQPYIDLLSEGKKVNLYPAASGKATPRNLINRLNIFAPTEISKTDQDTTALWRAIRAVIGDATDKATIVQRLDALVNAPQRLVAQGVTGRGTLGNVDVANRLPMLRGIDWLAVPSLKPNKIAEIGNRNELMADIYSAVWNKVAPFNGLSTLKPGQRTLIESVPVVGTVYKGLRFPADVMRSIMSFNYLGLRPGNWFRNAGGGTAMLVGTDSYSLRPIAQIADWWGRKGGYMPTPRMANVTQGADITGRTLSGAGEVRDTSWFMTRGPQWWQDFNEKLFNIPYGSTEIKLGNVAVPVGEGAMYARGFDTPGRRAFYGGWNDVVNMELVPGLVQMGVPEDTAQLIGRKVLELGNDGSKGDVAQGVRKWVNGQKLPYDLADIGVPLEVLGPDARRAINQVLSDALPDQIDEVAQAVRDIIRQEKTRYGDLLRVSPKEPVGYEWTRAEVLADGADVVDGIVDAARRAGVPNIDEVTQQAQQVIQKHTDAVTNAMQRMSNELSGSLNMPQTWALAEDFWWDLYGRIRPAQKKVDDLSKTAAMRRTPEAWQAKWQGTLEEYSRLSDEIDQLAAQYRQWLLDLNNGGTYVRQGQPETFWDYIRQYIGWDEQRFMEAQQITLGPASAEFAEDWEKVISNNRAFVDNSFVSLFNTFQKFPNIDNFDILSAAIKNSKAQGAQVAAYLKPLRERALAGGMKWSEYYRLRDLTWQQYFDNVVLTNTAHARAAILNGLSEGVGSRLRWLDDGNVEWRLEGPAQTAGKWLARNADGRVEEFSTPLKGERGSVFAVPQEVLDDWNRITNQQGSVVDDILEQVQKDAQDLYDRAIGPRRQYQAPTVTEYGRMPRQNPDVPLRDQPLRKAYQTPELTERGRWDIGPEAYGPEPYTPPQPTGPTRPAINPADPVTNKIDAFFDQFDTTPPIDPQTDMQGWIASLKQRFPKFYGDTPSHVTGKRPHYDAKGRLVLNNKALENGNLVEPQGPITVKPGTHAVLPGLYYDGQNGWKFHLVTTKWNHDKIAQVLDGMGIDNYKILAGGDPGDKDFTIYVGAREVADYLAPILETKLAGLIDDPLSIIDGDIAGGNLPFTQHIWARFAPEDLNELPSEINGIVNRAKMHRYGPRGIVISEFDMRQGMHGGTRPADTYDYALKRLTDEFGEYFTGRPRTQAALPQVPRGATPYTSPELYNADQGYLRGRLQHEGSGIVDVGEPRYVREGELPVEPGRMAGDRLLTGAVPEGAYVEPPRVEPQAPPTKSDAAREMFNWQHYQASVPDLDITDGMNPREWIRWLSERILKDRDNGGIRGLDVGDMATKGIATLDDAERHILSQLPRWVEGLPNTIPPGLRMQVVDAVDDFLPRFDDALSMAAEVGRQMGDFNMLDFSSRRAVDTALTLTFPYHYFSSRMGSRMAALALTKPEFVRAFYSMQRGIELENEQSGLPMRMQGTLPSLNPKSMWRYGNPITYVIPAFQYIQPNPFVDPNDANNDTERWMYKWQQWTPGMFPYLQYMQDALMDTRSPKRDVKRTDKYQVGDIVPLARIAGYAGAATTGEAGMLAGPQMEMLPPRLRSFLKLGDEWDFGRIGREIAKMVVGGEVDPETARWARDQAYQVQNAVGPLPEEDTEAAREVFERGTQRASVNRLWALLGGWLVGMPIYEYSPEEEAARQVLRERDAQGYDPATGQGSMAAIKEYEAQPMPGTDVTKGDVYDATREYSSLYPSEGNRPVPPTYPYRQPFNAQRPGVVQATEDKRSEAKQIRDQYSPQLDALAEAKEWQQFYALLDEQDQALAALDAKYPSAQPDTDQAALGAELLAEIERSQAQPPTDPTRIGQPQEAIDYYSNYSPEELAVKAAENAEYIAYAMNADIKPPRQKPADMSWDTYNRLREEYKAAVAADQAKLMQNPSSLVYGRPVGQASAGGVTPTKQEQATDKKAEAGKGGAAGAAGKTDSEGRPWSEYWDEYRAFGDDYAKKGEYLRSHPEFAAYYKARYLDENEEAWWERAYTSGAQAYSSWRGGYYGGGGGGGYSSYEKPKYIDRGTPAQAYMYRQYPYEGQPVKPAVYRAPDGNLYSINQLISMLGAKPNWRLHS